jgi:hypothetical protein
VFVGLVAGRGQRESLRMARVAGAQEMDGLPAHFMVGSFGRAVARTGRSNHHAEVVLGGTTIFVNVGAD